MWASLLLSLFGAVGMASLSLGKSGEDDEETAFNAPDASETQQGSANPDLMQGTDADDWIAGARGFDTIHGGAGQDTLEGLQGRDLMTGGLGDDLMDGGAWHDALAGNEGDDTMNGGTGMDTLLGGDGADSLTGGAWHDLLIGGTGADFLEGDQGDDILIGNSPVGDSTTLTAQQFYTALDQTYAAAGADATTSAADQTALAQQAITGLLDTAPAELPSEDAADTLDGGAGEDSLFLGANDVATGGDGADNFYVGNWVSSGADITDFTTGTDYLTVTYDGSTGALAPIIGVTTLANGDQVVTADGTEVARLIQPVTPATVDDVEVVALLA